MRHENVSELWSDYQATGSVAIRNELVLRYSSLVRYVAAKVGAGLPDQIEKDDLVSHGTLGLISAISKFDPTRGNKFETYAVPRIRGEIIDQLRIQDRVPRSVRKKSKDLSSVVAELESELGRHPDDAEVAKRLDINLMELWVLQREASVSTQVPLDGGDDDERASVSDVLADLGANPADLFGPETEIAQLVAAAIEPMSVRSKTIVVLYYLHEMTLTQIGSVLGVTESRVCQLQSRLLESLRDSLANGRASLAA